MSTKNDWKNIGKGFRDLGLNIGKTTVKTVLKGAQKAEDWANSDEKTEDENIPTVEGDTEAVKCQCTPEDNSDNK